MYLINVIRLIKAFMHADTIADDAGQTSWNKREDGLKESVLSNEMDMTFE